MFFERGNSAFTTKRTRKSDGINSHRTSTKTVEYQEKAYITSKNKDILMKTVAQQLVAI